MKRKVKLISCICMFCLLFAVIHLQAQNVSTFYTFGAGVNNPNNFVTDASGNFYFVNYDVNWQLQISKLTPGGIISVVVSGNYNPQNLTLDNAGNLYFIDQANWPFEIKKITPDGTMSSFVSGNYYPQNLIADNLGNLFFLDQMNWPYDIKKVTPGGTVSSLISGDFYPQSMVSDVNGNLYFIDQNNWPYEVKKITPDGTMSSFVSGNYYPQSLVTDGDGNLFFIDQMNWPYEIKKVTADGTVSSFVSGDYYPQSMITDNSGNLYFIDQMNWPYAIQKVTPDGTISSFVSGNYNPQNMLIDHSGNVDFIDNNSGPFAIMTATQQGFVCVAPPAPVTTNLTVCSGSATTLSAEGIGAIKWYDAAVNGNLVYDNKSFTTPGITSETTWYAEAVFCGLSSGRTAATVAVSASPTASVAGNLTGNDYVTLTASGGSSYLWTGGLYNTAANNLFTSSGTYAVTVTNDAGCSNTASVAVLVYKFGVTRYGQLSTDIPVQLNNYGVEGSTTRVNKHGKISSSTPADGNLNYEVFTSSGSYANNANDFIAMTNPANQTSAGSYAAATLLNWSYWNMLTDKGIAVPNGGDRFSVVVSGFFIPEESGVYTFTCEGDDAVDLFVNGVNVANHYGAHGIAGLGSHTGTITLTAGTKYSFRARMQENGGGEGLLVFWRKPSESSGWNLNTTEISSY